MRTDSQMGKKEKKEISNIRSASSVVRLSGCSFFASSSSDDGEMTSIDTFLPRLTDSSSLEELSSYSSSSLVSAMGLFSLSYISFSRRSSPGDTNPASEDPRPDPVLGCVDRLPISDRRLSMPITLPLSVADLLDLKVDVARLRGLELSQRFRGEMERPTPSREGSRESSEDPRAEPWRTESRPLEVKVGSPTFKSRPDIIAATVFFPVDNFSCARVGDVGEGEGISAAVAVVIVGRLGVLF